LGIKKSTAFSRFYTGLVGLILLFTASIVFSEQNAVRLKIVPQNPIVNEEFRVEIYVSGNFFTDVSILPPERMGVFKITGGPYIRPDVSKNGIIISFTVRSRSKGKHLLRSFVIKSGSSRVKTEEVLINVIRIKQEVLWQVPKKTVYIGEAVPVKLQLSLWNVPEIPVSVDVRVPKNALLEEFSLYSGIKEKTEDERKHFIIPLKAFLVTPARTGYIRLPAARVLLSDNRKYYSKAVTLRVIPLPKRLQKSKAIGTFYTGYSIKPEKAVTGKEVTVKVTLSGRGNLNYLRLPVPEISGKPLKRTEKVNNFYASEKGYTGSVTEIYKFRLKNPGSYRCIVPAFYYLDSKTQRVKKIADWNLNFKVIKEKEAKSAKTQVLFNKWPLMNINRYRVFSYKKMYRIAWVYLFFLPGPFLIIIFLVLDKIKKRKRKWKIPVLIVVSLLLLNGTLINRHLKTGSSEAGESEAIEKALKYYDNADYENALNIFLKIADKTNNPAVIFNIAACYNGLDDYIEAIHYLRKMLKLDPASRTAIKYLVELERKEGLVNQIPASIRFNPDYFFILEVLIFNLFCLFLVLYIRRRNIRIVLFLIVLSIVFFISAGYLIYSINYINKKTGVIAVDQGELKKIPESIANAWVTLKGGTAVEVLESAGRYSLIRTGDGLLGWILRGSILPDYRTNNL